MKKPITFSNADNLHFLNGEWLTSKDMKISVFDLSVIRGYGVFDFVKSYNHKFIWSDEYIDRFFRSAFEYCLPIPYTKNEIKTLLNIALEKNPKDDIYIRILLTGGISENTLSLGRNHSFMMLINYIHPIDSELYEKGGRFITHVGPRISPAVKSTNYTNSIYARHKYKNEKFTDILLVDTKKDPNIYEGSVNNIFFVRENKIITTPEKYVLDGIMKRKTIDSINLLGIELEYRFVKMSELKSMDEAFATNSSLKVYPVTSINSQKISNYAGLITKRVANKLNELIEKEITLQS